MTDRHRYEQRLRVLNRVLRHDLRNDVNVVLGNADLLLESNLPAETKRYARTIKGKASSLVELGERARQIDHTLHGSDDGQRPVDVVAPIERTLDAVEEEYLASVVLRNYPEKRWVAADSLIDSALSNVLENAVEHNDRALPEVEVTVETATVGGRETVEVRVADNGLGIPESERRAISRGIETKLAHVSGLGLWLAKWIVDQSSGDIRFAQNDPRGTIVGIRLPAAAPPDDPPRPDARSPSAETD